jgi:hypothetical protein
VLYHLPLSGFIFSLTTRKKTNRGPRELAPLLCSHFPIHHVCLSYYIHCSTARAFDAAVATPATFVSVHTTHCLSVYFTDVVQRECFAGDMIKASSAAATATLIWKPTLSFTLSLSLSVAHRERLPDWTIYNLTEILFFIELEIEQARTDVFFLGSCFPRVHLTTLPMGPFLLERTHACS